MLATLLLADGRFPAGSHAHSAGVEAACADGRITDESSLHELLEGRLRTAGLVDAALAATTWLALAQCATSEATDGRQPATDTADEARPRSAGHADAEGGRQLFGPIDADGEVRLSGLADASMRWVLVALDREAEARIVVPSLRAASRQLGRQLVRVGRRCWPDEVLTCIEATMPHGAHQPVALGAVGLAAGCDAKEVARLAVHHVLTTPAQAAVRLLGLDPFAVAAVTAGLGPLAEQVVSDAIRAARTVVQVDAEVAGAATGGADWPASLADLPAFTSPLVEIAAVEHAAWEVRLFAT